MALRRCQTDGAVIENLTIKGFRGIEALEVPRCGRINVVVGRNGSGKTRLLEALFAFAVRAEVDVIPNLALTRGVPEELPALQRADYFTASFATRGRDAAELEGRIDGVVRSNVLSRFSAESLPFAPPRGADGMATGIVPVAGFEIRTTERVIDASGVSREHTSNELGFILPDHRWWKPLPRPPQPGPRVRLRSTRRLNAIARVAQQWSAVEALGETARQRVLEVLQRVDPALMNLRVVALENSVAQLRAEHREMGPCALEWLGDGLVETLNYLTLMLEAQGGVLLFDEFGTALDAKNQTVVIRALLDAARDFDVQLFLSTHSLEVVDALLADAPADALLLMQMKSEGGSVSIETLAHDEAKALRDDLGFDLRRVA